MNGQGMRFPTEVDANGPASRYRIRTGQETTVSHHRQGRPDGEDDFFMISVGEHFLTEQDLAEDLSPLD
ncbi:MAG: hypothetical protein F4090_07010 [Nitrospira sp. SB0672_bin_25]|nr:hypothetical protein [Nitrospira sp. SB0672_bin_25]